MKEAMGVESTSDKETKEFCGAARPSKVLKRMERNSYCPLIAPKKSVVKLAQTIFRKCLLQRGGREFLSPRLITTVQSRSPRTKCGESFRVGYHPGVRQTSQQGRRYLSLVRLPTSGLLARKSFRVVRDRAQSPK